MRHASAIAAFACAASIALAAQAPPTAARRTIRVRETMGIRRTEYPVTARLTFRKGVLKDPAETRLLLNDAEVVRQVTRVSGWDDGSVQAMEVDFNASLDPDEEKRFQLQYGSGVASTATLARGGLSVQDEPDVIQVGAVRFSKSGAPLIRSAAYRGEGIGSGPNGVIVSDSRGQRHDLANAQNPTMEAIKRGPLRIALRYTATLPLEEGYSVPVEVQIDMPNSKSWVKTTATVRDSGRKVRDIAFDTPLAFGSMPILWDFATDSGTYGVFRNAADGVVLTQTKDAASANWKVATTAQGQRRPYEQSAGARVKTASGWGHLQDAKAAVAWAVEGFGRENGTWTVTLDGKGQTSFRFAPSEPTPVHRLTVYEHFVATPVAIGAATNPMAMLNPLVVTVE